MLIVAHRVTDFLHRAREKNNSICQRNSMLDIQVDDGMLQHGMRFPPHIRGDRAGRVFPVRWQSGCFLGTHGQGVHVIADIMCVRPPRMSAHVQCRN